MDDASNTAVNRTFFPDFADAAEEEEEEEEDEDGFCDVDTWETLSRSFREVQSLLDRNRRLIQQVNDNHRSKIPHNLAKNVDLICEINANMSKIISLYSGLSANLSAVVRQRRAAAAAKEIQIVKKMLCTEEAQVLGIILKDGYSVTGGHDAVFVTGSTNL